MGKRGMREGRKGGQGEMWRRAVAPPKRGSGAVGRWVVEVVGFQICGSVTHFDTTKHSWPTTF